MSDDPNVNAAYALKTAEDSIRLYRDWAETYDADFVRGTTYQSPELAAAAYLKHGGGWPCLDAGCGTGAVAGHLPGDAVIDGLDISPEMLAIASRKGRYRTLIEADLKRPIPLGDGAYKGLVSAGTFTHGHVGPEALAELIRVLAKGSLGVIASRPDVWRSLEFDAAFDDLRRRGEITPPEIVEHAIYRDPARAPEGRGGDVGCIVVFRRL